MATKKSTAAAKTEKAAKATKPKMREVPRTRRPSPARTCWCSRTRPERDYVIQFQVPEFTCHCPLTGQPDFAHFTIDMIADELCVELKSLKMYFWSYRNEGAFHEKVTNTILDDIVKATDPRFIRITAKWYVRGGIYTNVVAEHRKPGWKPAPRVDLPAHGPSPGCWDDSACRAPGRSQAGTHPGDRAMPASREGLHEPAAGRLHPTPSSGCAR
jgi:7-cyano-7-deazaguanine reductase